MGFEPYDGPLLEPIELYLNKTSEELIKKQAYTLKDKNDQTLLLRPEMTPSMARMVAARANELVFPLKLFNLGLRYRYEAPQKGRGREFMQTDFDILGTNSFLADAEIINAAVQILLEFGATDKDFKVLVNSRRFMESKLLESGVNQKDLKQTLNIIDRVDKSTQNLPEKVNELIKSKIKPADDKYFNELFDALKKFGIDKYCQIDLAVVRGLDYYTGLVFEIKKENREGRATIVGGGRYDNLVSDFNPNLKIPGVGFAVSDVVILEFIKDIDKLPTLKTKQTQVLVTIFGNETVGESITTLSELRKNKIAAEIYPDPEKKT
jgi:histidyl-tRNA synthetase